MGASSRRPGSASSAMRVPTDGLQVMVRAQDPAGVGVERSNSCVYAASSIAFVEFHGSD